MTLDLGFAHLLLPDSLEAGIVDVPGHERFLHNMLAGAAGMDVLLLAVAANEGVMPQTLEHLDILRYLNVRATIVALTKIDVVPAEQRDEARAAVEASLRGTIAEGAPVVAVSSVSGEGLDALRAEIARTLRSLSPRDPDAPVYLPVDRVFTLAGLGTVVTGTLMQGSIATGDAVLLSPSGIEARARSLQVFGAARSRVEAGSRVAINLAGVERSAIARGEAIVPPRFEARATLAVRFTPLPDALALLRRRTPVRAYLGSAEILGTLVMEDLPAEVREVRAELRLRSPVAAFPGVRFVVRRPSPKTLLGGGRVEGVVAAGESEESSTLDRGMLAALAERGLEPLDAATLALAVNVREDVAKAALDALADRGDVVRVRRPLAYLDRTVAVALYDRALETLGHLHRDEPWAMGLTSVALSRVLGLPEPLLVRVLAEFVDQGRLAATGGYYAALEHSPAFTGEQRDLFDSLLRAGDQPLLPVPFETVVAGVRGSAVKGAGKAFDTLLARGAVVKIGDELYRGAQLAQVCARVEEYLRRNERMTAAQFRDLIGTSRKYAVPLLEWLDARGITLRNGDYRTLRKKV